MKNIKKFKVDTEELSQKEKALFEKLVSAAEQIHPLYLRQRNNKYPGANFYPHDATKKEIKEAAQKNPKILDPYTFIERDKTGKLIAIPFHLKFKNELRPIAKLLIEAANFSDDKSFSRYLKSRANSLLNGDYEKSEIIWLKTEPFKFGFIIGPIERYLDRLFFKKCAYQSWVGILNEEKTREAGKFKKMVLASRKKILPGSEKVDVSRLDIRVDKTVIFSGLIADFMFTGTNLPNDVNLMEKYGSNLTIFETSLDENFKNGHFLIFKAIFDKEFQKSYSKADLYAGSLRCILVHEICHSLMRYRDAEERLEDIFPVFDELYGYILGIKSCGTLLLKGALTQKELEAILVMYICRNFTWWLDSIKNPDVTHYATGAAIALNFFLREKAIKRSGGISWPDFTKLFICIDELSHILEYHLALGNYQDAKEFIKKYGSFDVFKPFSPQLLKIPREV